MAKYLNKFPPLPLDEESLLLTNDLTSASLPAGMTAYGNGTFSSAGYNCGTTGSIGITGLTDQANIVGRGGFISFDVETRAICKDDSLDVSDVTQSAGIVRAATAYILAINGAGGAAVQLRLYMHSNGSIILYSNNASQTIFQPALSSVGKASMTNIMLAFYGNLCRLFIDGIDVARGVATAFDANQSATIFIGANGSAGANHFGPYTVKNLQLGLRPPLFTYNPTLYAIWGDSFINKMFGTSGGTITIGVREYDAVGRKVVGRLFMAGQGELVKIAGHGYSGFGWHNSFANPQTNNRAAIALTNPSVLLMCNSVNGIESVSVLPSDYQSSLEAHIDYVFANCSNLQKIIFVSMMPFSQNPADVLSKTNGVVEASNAVFAGLVDYVATNHPTKIAKFYDMFTLSGGHSYPAEWTYGVVANIDDLHPSTLGHAVGIAPRLYAAMQL